jgi:ABC-type polysaccharide/polyol phosphate export permease
VRGCPVCWPPAGTLLAIGLLTVFVSGVALWFAAVNVIFRDLQELFVVIFLVWFYATPVLYPLALARAELGSTSIVVRMLELNPMTWFVEAFRMPLYGTVRPVGPDDALVSPDRPTWPPDQLIIASRRWGSLSFVVGYAVFLRRSRSFAKEV